MNMIDTSNKYLGRLRMKQCVENVNNTGQFEIGMLMILMGSAYALGLSEKHLNLSIITYYPTNSKCCIEKKKKKKK